MTDKARHHSIICTLPELSVKVTPLLDAVWPIDSFPIPLLRDPSFIARAYYGNMNFFGGPSTTSVKASAKLKQLEEENEDAMFVIVSDVWLDSVEVMEKLNLMFSGLSMRNRRLWLHRSTTLHSARRHWRFASLCFFLKGYSAMPPTCFIFCGNFSSAPYGNTQIKSMKGGTFRVLITWFILTIFRSLRKST